MLSVQKGDNNNNRSNTIMIFLYIVSWYTTNSVLILLNKYLISFYGYQFPIFITMCHMISSGFFSVLSGFAGIFEIDQIKSLKQGLKVSFLSAIFVASLMLANMSLKFVPVSFNQAIGATTPFFAAILAAILQKKIEHSATYSTLFPVILGIVIASNGEPDLHFLGFFFCVFATFCRGLKSVVQSILMTQNEEKLNSQSLLMYMSPFAILYLIPCVIIIEPTAVQKTFQLLGNSPEFVMLFTLNVFCAYLANLFNFLITKQLGALSLQVLGNLKGVFTSSISVGIFQNPVTPMGFAGYALTIIGVFLYKEAKNQFQIDTKQVKY